MARRVRMASSAHEWRPESALELFESAIGDRRKLLKSPKRQRRLRIAARRLDALLLAFGERMPAGPAAELASSLRAVRGAAGAARDAGLAMALAAPRLERYPDATRAVERTLELRARQATGTLKELTAKSERAALLELAELLVDAAVVVPGSPAAITLPRRALARGLMRLRQSLRPEAPSPESVHRIRRRFKEIRYTLEALGPLLPPVPKALRARLTAVQRSLGDIGDLAVVCELLKESERGAPTGARRELRIVRRSAAVDLDRLARSLHHELHSPRALALVAELTRHSA